jgi:hypothetical protein
MIASDAKVPNIAAARLWMTGNCRGSTTEVVDKKNEKKPTMAVRKPIAAISNASLKRVDCNIPDNLHQTVSLCLQILSSRSIRELFSRPDCGNLPR